MAVKPLEAQAATFRKNLAAQAPQLAAAVRAAAEKARTTKPGTAAHKAALENVARDIAAGLANAAVSPSGAKLSANDRKAWANQLTPSLIDTPPAENAFAQAFNSAGLPAHQKPAKGEGTTFRSVANAVGEGTTKKRVKASSTGGPSANHRTVRLPKVAQTIAPSVAAASIHAAVDNAVQVPPAQRTAAALNLYRQVGLGNPSLTPEKTWEKAATLLNAATHRASWVPSALQSGRAALQSDPTAAALTQQGHDDAAAAVALAKVNRFYSPDSRALIDEVAKIPGLTPVEISHFTTILGGDSPTSAKARSGLLPLLASPQGRTAATVRTYFDKENFIPGNSNLHTSLADKAFPFPQVGAPQTHADGSLTFHVRTAKGDTPVTVSKAKTSADGKAHEYVFSVNGQKIHVSRPIKPIAAGPKQEPTQSWLAASFASLPSVSLAALAQRNVSLLNKASSSGVVADTSDKTVRILPNAGNWGKENFSSFVGVIIHETGHIYQSEHLSATDNARWKQAVVSDASYASVYAQHTAGGSHLNNIKEDFAETYAIYLVARGTPQEKDYRSLTPARFALLDSLLPPPTSHRAASTTQ